MEVFAGHLQPIHHPWIPAFAGITMALRRSHKRMKMVGGRAVQRAGTSGPS